MKTERFEMRADADFLKAIDEWRRLQPDLPSRAEAVRRIVQSVSMAQDAGDTSAKLSSLIVDFFEEDTERRRDEWFIGEEIKKPNALVERFFKEPGRRGRPTQADVRTPAVWLYNAMKDEPGDAAAKICELLIPLTK